ncbi:MAG TPA: hypothetical protein VGS58_10585 [Candidatus Sulfopaludibacter sp.]|nr:hypothetical protein [Candidatus Sulfopaludibacter sp.]
MNKYLRIGPQSLACGLAALLAFPSAGQVLPSALAIVVEQGEGAVGTVGQLVGRDPAVRVVDENRKPVSDVAVVFTLPTEGATGTFGNGAKALTVMTDGQGMAAASHLRLSKVPGKVQVHVNASFKGLTARTNFTLISEAPAGYKPGGGSGKIVAILAILAAGGAGGAVYAVTRNHGNTPPSSAPPALTPIGITPGTGTLAPPH